MQLRLSWATDAAHLRAMRDNVCFLGHQGSYTATIKTVHKILIFGGTWMTGETLHGINTV